MKFIACLVACAVLAVLPIVNEIVFHPPRQAQPPLACKFPGLSASVSIQVPDEYSGFHKRLDLTVKTERPADLTVRLPEKGPGSSWFLDPWELNRSLSSNRVRCIAAEPEYPDLEGPEGSSFTTESEAVISIQPSDDPITFTVPVHGRYYIPELSDSDLHFYPPSPKQAAFVAPHLRCSVFSCDNLFLSIDGGNSVSGEPVSQSLDTLPTLCVPVLYATQHSYTLLLASLLGFMAVSVAAILRELFAVRAPLGKAKELY